MAWRALLLSMALLPLATPAQADEQPPDTTVTECTGDPFVDPSGCPIDDCLPVLGPGGPECDPPCKEDMPCFDCATMGNRWCGPGPEPTLIPPLVLERPAPAVTEPGYTG